MAVPRRCSGCTNAQTSRQQPVSRHRQVSMSRNSHQESSRSQSRSAGNPADHTALCLALLVLVCCIDQALAPVTRHCHSADPDFAALMTMPAATADPYAYTARSPPAVGLLHASSRLLNHLSHNMHVIHAITAC